MYRWCIRPLLFRCDPEWVHERTLALGQSLGAFAVARKMLARLYTFCDPRLRTTVAGLDFENPVGLAAGFDKSGRAAAALATMGFGAVEIGSVSAHASRGNSARPRLFRLPDDLSIVVYYGVPNDGAAAVATRLHPLRLPVPLGVNLVETNTGRPTRVDETIAELVQAAAPFVGLADYLTLNLNCPNTTGGHSPFDEPAPLRTLLAGYRDYADLPPVFLKLQPTVDPAQIDAVLETADPFCFVRGVIFSLPPGKPYSGLKTPATRLERMPGNLCGPPTRQLVDEAVRVWYARLDPDRFALVGTGGIFSAADAYRRIRLGASLVQLYTALIYHGPGLAKKINRGLCRLLERDGFENISAAVGVDQNRELANV